MVQEISPEDYASLDLSERSSGTFYILDDLGGRSATEEEIGQLTEQNPEIFKAYQASNAQEAQDYISDLDDAYGAGDEAPQNIPRVLAVIIGIIIVLYRLTHGMRSSAA